MMRRVGRLSGWACLAVAVCVVPAALGAQERPRRGEGRMGPRQERSELEQRVRQRFGEMIRVRLELTDEQAAELRGVMERFQADRVELARDDEALRLRFQAVLTEQGTANDEAEALLGRMMDIRERELGLFRAEQEALAEVLTPAQLVRFHAMREQLNQRVRALRQRGRPPGGQGMPPRLEGYPHGVLM